MIELIPVRGLPEIREGDDLAALVVERIELRDRDVVVLAQKAVSKQEGRIIRIDSLEASEKAIELAGDERDPREVEAVLREAKRIVRERGPLVIAETQHGFICASAGVDHSNAPEPGTLVLLPVDPDASARAFRARVRELTGRDVGVVITDSFGRPFRLGTVGTAVGVAGLPSLWDRRGERDLFGRPLEHTVTALADQVAAVADLVAGQAAERRPVVVVRGLRFHPSDAGAAALLRSPGEDLYA